MHTGPASNPSIFIGVKRVRHAQYAVLIVPSTLVAMLSSHCQYLNNLLRAFLCKCVHRNDLCRNFLHSKYSCPSSLPAPSFVQGIQQNNLLGFPRLKFNHPTQSASQLPSPTRWAPFQSALSLPFFQEHYTSIYFAVSFLTVLLSKQSSLYVCPNTMLRGFLRSRCRYPNKLVRTFHGP